MENGRYFGVAGIIINTIGTILTLWTLISTKLDYVGTVAEYSNRPKEFQKEKRLAILGLIAITVGNTLQMAGVLL